ncbi:MAG TPA: MBL fold metallo-hydrolase [Planctomycetota bacterium]|nr:MBL fold metallo-hydrolase [Planctomycetota bacterium]
MASAFLTWPRTIHRWEIETFKQAILRDTMRSIRRAPNRPEPEAWSKDAVTFAWLGHSTVLINFFGINILTDPVLGARVGLKVGPFVIGPKRFVQPALKWWELPPLDVVLVSHAHFDHLDIWSLRKLGGAPIAVTSKHSADLFRWTWMTHVRELDWHEQTTLFPKRGGLRIEAFPTSHWGARLRSDHHRRWNGYVLERHGVKLMFAGDTGYTRAFENLRGGGPYDVAIMPIGAYEPWVTNHCTPEQALSMADAAGARFILPVHHQTFKLSWEPVNEPIKRLKDALRKEPKRLALQEIGETFVLPHYERASHCHEDSKAQRHKG